ncbi:zinc-binding alcohol dehydrogenase family protein [Candidatus Latescibacterota bacterium]
MKTIVCQAPDRLIRTDTPEPGDPGPGEALVRVHRCGICGTDLHAYKGRQPFLEYPRILGHELGVEVVAVGEGVGGLKEGDRCAVEPYLNCGVCGACRRGRANCCEHLQTLGVHTDGGMRERLILPADKLHCSRSLSLDQLALVETLGIGCHAVARTRPQEGEAAFVIGAGPIGLSVVEFARAAGARVIVQELNENRLRFCRDHCGIHGTIADADPVPRLRELLKGDLPTAVLDATGSPESMMAAFGYVANGGRLTYVGFQPRDLTFANPEFHRREMTLLASRNALAEDFRQVLGLLESGVIDTDPWLTHRATYEDLPEQFPAWTQDSSGVLKAMLEL